VRLDTTRTIRIAQSELKMLDSVAAPPPPTVASAFTTDRTDEWTDIVIPINARPAFLVEEGPGTVTLTLYNTEGPEKNQMLIKAPDTTYLKSISSFSKASGHRPCGAAQGTDYYCRSWTSANRCDGADGTVGA
jgi:hypothetical protein